MMGCRTSILVAKFVVRSYLNWKRLLLSPDSISKAIKGLLVAIAV
jgi:hypothetical protein